MVYDAQKMTSCGISVACVLGAFCSFYFLYLDYHMYGPRGLGLPVGKIEHSEFSVRRKAGQSFLWGDVYPDSPLYSKDSIKTGPGSSAIVNLKDNQVLEIGENSLVILDERKKLTTNFVQGSFVVRDSVGDKKIQVDKLGRVSTEVLKVRLNEPLPHSQFLVAKDQTANVAFSWSGVGNSKVTDSANFKLQLSKDATFKKIETYAIPSGRLDRPVHIGAYFWRIVDGEAPASETRKLFVKQLQIPTPLSPSQEKALVYEGAPSLVNFKWSPVSANDDSKGLLEISSDPGFKASTKMDVALAAEQVTVRGLAPGAFYWRMLESRDGRVFTGDSTSFKLEKSTRLQLTLLQPGDDLAVPVARNVSFEWMQPQISQGTPLDYKWQVRRLADRAVVTELRTRLNSAAWALPPIGHYEWRVSANLGGASIGESNWRRVTIFSGQPLKLTSPIRREKIFHWKEAPLITFSWEAIQQATYEWEFAEDPDFSVNAIRIKTGDTTLPKKDLNLYDRKYYWRVTAYDFAGNALRSSPVFDLDYESYPVLGAPVQKMAGPFDTWDLVKKHENFIGVWSAVPQATGYEVTIERGGGLVVQSSTTEPHFEFSGLKIGDYTWEVRAIDPLGRPGIATTPRKLVVIHTKLSAPRKVTSEVE